MRLVRWLLGMRGHPEQAAEPYGSRALAAAARGGQMGMVGRARDD
jgi:hypothetical protein